MKGFVVWLTGIPASGKSTIAAGLAEALRAREVPVEVLDGEELRKALGDELGFSKADRDRNIRRIGFVARLLARHGVAAVVAAVSPYREVRDEVRAATAPAAFLEVHVHCPIQTAFARDPKRLYRRARAGEVRGVTGIDDPYEPPLAPEVLLDTDREGPPECVAKVLAALEARGLVQSAGPAYTPEEEAAIRERLEGLGYL